MKIVWLRGSVTAELVRELLPRRLKGSTVRTVLWRLDSKGYVRHTMERRTYFYHSVGTRGQIAAKAVQRVADRLYNGSVDQMLIAMMKAGVLDETCLRVLADVSDSHYELPHVKG
ncbi:BlaI/MecI/CopY family transcriptional regulator [Bradyrhizobium sp. SHOUNA76]|nr:BlaI/MecI/CopY family transcriptional regulator [Bradyrhizobium sp. SHOUNA76]MCJ9732352.1 BlaI/MecI/CopY family transcriptional regulator [Bradyrhizobium sp. PRIMUS42]